MARVERHTPRLPVAVLFAILLALGVLMMSGCNRIGDNSKDATTIQGEWQVVGTKMTFVITDNQIRMPDDVSYDYTIDTANREIDFSVGDVKGSATYELSTDKNTGLVTLALIEMLDGSETTTHLVKLSDNTKATPSLEGGSSVFATTDESESTNGTGTTTDNSSGTSGSAQTTTVTTPVTTPDVSTTDTTADTTTDTTGTGEAGQGTSEGATDEGAGGTEDSSSDDSSASGMDVGSISDTMSN